MGILYHVWCVYSPNDIGNGPDVKVFFFSIGIVFSNICVSWLYCISGKDNSILATDSLLELAAA